VRGPRQCRGLFCRQVFTQGTFPLTDANAALGSRFRVGNLIRGGGQGVVCRGSRTSAPDGNPTNDDCAVKYYFDPAQDERVDREIRALEGFRHPNLANIVEHGRISVGGESVRYVAWEYIDGDPLDMRIKATALPGKTVACVARDVARAIDHIWSKRIVHRDVAPKNMMLRKGDLEAVLIDLGIARHLFESPLTAPGLTWGTYGYLSPEQCRAEPNLTCHSDVFSLGVSLQEALAGRHPTRGDQQILITAPPKTADVAPSSPAALANLIDLMLSLRAPFRPLPGALVIRFADLAASL
jgi:eukaryotic-like serine/threonine-protein kinase